MLVIIMIMVNLELKAQKRMINGKEFVNIIMLMAHYKSKDINRMINGMVHFLSIIKLISWSAEALSLKINLKANMKCFMIMENYE